ncbi:MAG TPA: nucleotidyltransferase family protein [Pyrinomonadaceae bacterium]|nr:nucleotidyltransferase family protein [Pyrinomonadaceae bacterium]
MSLSVREKGRLLARVLAGSWRATPPEVDFSGSDLEAVAPLLNRSGTGALAWWRVRVSTLRGSPVASDFQQMYRANILESRLGEEKIRDVVEILRSSGIDAVLVKGLTVARHYCERGLRPYGDIDVCVRPAQYAAAGSALAQLNGKHHVDLHSGFETLGDEDAEQLFARSRLLAHEDLEVRVLAPEDLFRVVCFHMLREGAWRPLWLVDVASLLESLPSDFDWDLCLGEKRRAQYVGCAVRLTRDLLGANFDLPSLSNFQQLPRWVVPTVLSEWGEQVPSMRRRHERPMADHIRHPANLISGLRHRWPNPIEATILMKSSISESPRLPIQVRACLSRTAAFLFNFSERWS